MDLVLTAVAPVFALILCGYLCGRTGILGPAATESLNLFVVWLALPALLLPIVARARGFGDAGFALAFGSATALTFALSFALDRRPGHRLADRSIEGLDAAYGNTGFLGIPLGLALFGPAGLPAVIVASLITVCALFGVAVALIEVDLGGGTDWRRVGTRLARSLGRNPIIVSPVLGAAYALTGLPLPEPVTRFTDLLGAAASPCALVTVGLFLAQRHEPTDLATVARLVGLKLVIHPALTALLAFKLFAMPVLWSHAALLLSALPTGTGPFMLAKLYDRRAADTSGAILVSTVLSLLSVSLIVAWFGRV